VRLAAAAGPSDSRSDAEASRQRTRAIADSWPFVLSPDLVTDDVRLDSPACRQLGQSGYLSAMRAFRDGLPLKLVDFKIVNKTVPPPDSGLMRCRCTVSFAAPLPPQILPAQRARLSRELTEQEGSSGGLTLRTDGLVEVQVVLSAVLRLDQESGRVREHVEYFSDADPLAVPVTIARFNYLFAKFQAAAAVGEGGVALPPPVLAFLTAGPSYLAVLREITRLEVDEVARRQETDESRVLFGGGEMSEGEFNRFFWGFVGQNFALGGAIGFVIYAAARLPVWLPPLLAHRGDITGGAGGLF